MNESEKEIKPLWWTTILLLMSICYLFPEMIFNAELVAVAGGREISDAQLHAVELFGRTISGIGVTILVADLLIKGTWLSTKTKATSAFIIVLLLCWPTVFWGQKWAVNKFIIDPSTAKQRQQAFASQMIRATLAENTIQIKGIPFRPELPNSASEMTFLALFGGLVYADDKLIESIESQVKNIISNFVRSRAEQNFNTHYEKYQIARRELRELYTEYAGGSRSYYEEQQKIPGKVEEYWNEVEDNVKKGWDSYQAAIKAHKAKAEAKANVIAPKIYDYFDTVQDCNKRSERRRATCLEYANERYDEKAKSYGLGYITSDYWLIEEDVSMTENVTKTLLGGVLTMGISLLGQAADAASGGDGGFPEKRYKYTDEVSHYTEKILALETVEKMFIDQTGYPSNLADISTFRYHPETGKKVGQAFNKKGILLPEGWTLRDKASFEHAAEKRIKDQIDSAWSKKLASHGVHIKPGLSWNEFQRNKDIQNRFKERMGEYYINPMSADWNNKQFHEKVIEPNVKRKVDQVLTYIKANEKEFADGGKYADLGKRSLRSIIIPPISMTLSLFLVIMTVLKIPGKFLTVWHQWLANGKTSKKSHKMKLVFTGIAMLAVIVTPLTLVKSKYTDSGSTTHYFLDRVEKHGSPIYAVALKWGMHTQPLFQPLGRNLEERLGLMRTFKHAIKQDDADNTTKNI